MSFKKRITCIGAGYVGGPTMAVIAQKCPDYKVTVVDINQQRIDDWNSPDYKLPIYEPGLEEVVREARGRNLFFSTDIPAAIEEAEIIFISVNTPTKTYGEGAGKASNLEFVEKTARSIVQYAKSNKIVVEKSTLPIRTAEAIERILKTNDKGLQFQILSNPEFLAEGSAISDLHHPDRVLIGSHETPEGLAAREELVKIYARWVPRERILVTNVWSSELSKLAANAFLAQRVTSINSIASLCERTEADVEEVARAIGMDSRIGNKFLKASVGFGGSCFKKDILNLSYLCDYYGLHEVACYWESVVELNEWNQRMFVNKMLHSMLNTLSDKRVAVLGFAFKANTGDTRETPANTVVRELLNEHANVAIYDPQAIPNAKLDLADLLADPETAKRITFCSSAEEACAGADAIAVVTEWEEFKQLDYKKIYALMRKPACIFDGRNILDRQKLYDLGFSVFGIGKPSLTHF